MASEESTPKRQPVTLSAADITALADRMEARAVSIVHGDPPQHTQDCDTAARICRHILRVAWVRTSVAVA